MGGDRAGAPARSPADAGEAEGDRPRRARPKEASEAAGRSILITDVRVRIVEESRGKVLAFATIMIDDCFVVRDLRVVEGPGGRFVAMPDRERTSRCSVCGANNRKLASYCCSCGRKIAAHRRAGRPEARERTFAEVAHPITAECRRQIERAVLESYRRALLEK